jgi:hypothetical protein
MAAKFFSGGHAQRAFTPFGFAADGMPGASMCSRSGFLLIV